MTLDELKMGKKELALYKDYKSDLDIHNKAIEDYDAVEAMDSALTYDTESKRTENGLTDSMTATIYLERAARVAGQLPDGETEALGKKDKGKALLYDLLRTNWIYPNANSQYPFLTKLFLWQYMSSMYNVGVMHYDLVDNEATGYYGPDCWVINPRNFIPQAGETSVLDMDYAHGVSQKTYSFFEELVENEDDDYDLKELKRLLPVLKEFKSDKESERHTTGAKKKITEPTAHIEVVTRYESGKKGRWITFLPQFSCTVIRDIPNPHKNSRIPFVVKKGIPRVDDYYGVGDFQRSMPMQFANDGLDNFYFQGIKINMFPVHMVNMQTAVKNTIQPKPGAIWQFNGSPDARRMETSTAGLATYQAAKGLAKGAIHTIAGTTDTAITSESSSNPAMGRTPQALRMQAERESTRDNLDRTFLESALEELIDGMYSILPTMADSIPLDLFEKDIREIVEKGHEDVMDVIELHVKTGTAKLRKAESGALRLKLKPEAFKNIHAHFDIRNNSTAKQTREQQLQSLLEFWEFIGKMPNALQQYQENTGKTPDWEFVFSQMGDLMDLPFMKKMFTEAPLPPELPPEVQPEMGMPQGMPQGMPEMPQGMPQPPQGPMVTPPIQDADMPEEFLMVSDQSPVQIAGYTFTTPETAWEAYKEYVLITGQTPE